MVEPCLILLRRIAWAAEDRAAQLEPVVPLVLPALRAHAGTHTGIAEHGLAYLRMLAYEATCKVRAVGLQWDQLGRERRGHVSWAVGTRTYTYLLSTHEHTPIHTTCSAHAWLAGALVVCMPASAVFMNTHAHNLQRTHAHTHTACSAHVPTL